MMTSDDFPLLGSPMQRFLLRVRRVVDDSAYICAGCGRLTGGLAERCSFGWACSAKCGDRQRNLFAEVSRVGGSHDG